MATDTMPSTGTASRNSTADTVPNIVQLAQATGAATGAPAPAQPAAIPAAPNGEVHVAMPADQTVVRVQVAPGETIDLPFGDELAARFGEQGNLAVKVGDQTVILLNYAEANQQQGVTLHDSHGHNIDIASVVAQTDPNLDIQTAAGPAAGPAGAAGGHLFVDFNPGAGLGGFGELNVINPTALQYSLISPDETILPPFDRNGTNIDVGGHALGISSTDGSKIVSVTESWHSNEPTGNTDTGHYLQSGGIEGKPIGSGLGNNTGDLAIGTGDTILSLTFQSQVGSLHNMVGVYVTDADGNVISVKFVWLNAVSQGSGIGTDIYGNQQSANVNVDVGDVPPGGHVGYFLLQGGASNSHDTNIIKDAIGTNHGDSQSAVDALNSHDITISTNSSGKSTVSIDGQDLNSPVIASDNDKNSAQSQQTISGTDGTSDGLLYVGFEDRQIGPGLEGSTFKPDKDYNDVIFTVSSKTPASTSEVQTINPTVHLTDSDNDITQVSIDTTGFLVGDSLANLADSNGFHVVSTQGGDGQFHVTITEDAGTTHTTAQWETFLDSIGFSSTSETDGERQMTYTVHDSAGNTGSTTANIDVATQHDAVLSTENDALHHGAALLHSGSTAGHDVVWGDANDTLHLDQHFTATDGKLDMGAGDNTLSVGADGINITSADTSHLTNVDHIDMTGSGTNSTTLNGADVVSLLGNDHELKIDGDSGIDSVTLKDTGGADHWTANGQVTVGGQTYDQYQWHGGAGDTNNVLGTVLIDDHLTHTVATK